VISRIQRALTPSEFTKMRCIKGRRGQVSVKDSDIPKMKYPIMKVYKRNGEHRELSSKGKEASHKVISTRTNLTTRGELFPSSQNSGRQLRFLKTPIS